jgi:hypothetical protein
VTSSILTDTALADTIHALAELERRPKDLTFVRDRLAAMDAALSAFESTLAQPLAAHKKAASVPARGSSTRNPRRYGQVPPGVPAAVGSSAKPLLNTW